LSLLDLSCGFSAGLATCKNSDDEDSRPWLLGCLTVWT